MANLDLLGKETDPELLCIGDFSVKRGQTKQFELDIARLYDSTKLSMPISVSRGIDPGPVFFISAAVHGDEIIGTEVVKRILHERKFRLIRGSLVCIPIVNVFGFNNGSRYLPDRRDLNRSFPGSPTGPLSSRLAHLFLENIVKNSHYGIDLHSGAVHRANLPQIRACLDNPKTLAFAEAFGAPVTLNSKLRDGSIRVSAEDNDVTMLLFEGGEALRHDEHTIKAAMKGIRRCLVQLGMIKSKNPGFVPGNLCIGRSSYWVRAPQSGTMRILARLGKRVEKSTPLAVISNTFGEDRFKVTARKPGIIIGENRMPLVNQGDALFHVATFDESDLDTLSEEFEDYYDILNT